MNWEDLPPNPIGKPFQLSVAEFRKMIIDAEALTGDQQ
jgi:hypothetical protein